MASNVAFVQSVPALRAHTPVLAKGGVVTQPFTLNMVGAPESQEPGRILGSCATLAVVAAGAQRARRSKAQQQRPRLVMRAVAMAESVVPLTGCTLQAAMKMCCDTSGAGYAIYWANENGKLVVAGDYVSDARKEELKGKGFEKSFAEESEAYALDASGDGPVATVYNTKEPLFVSDIATSNLNRKDLATKYGLGQVCFIPFEAGVLEFGTSEGASTATWEKMPGSPLIPKAALRRGFENLGAAYAMFWAKEGESFKVVADYVTDAHRRALKGSRGDDETFCSKSREVTIDANGDGPIATAVKMKEEVKVMDTSVMRRAALANEFGIERVHFVPSDAGILEFGIPKNTSLTGPTLAASLKMRCDTSGAGYALYWQASDDKLVVAGDYVTPARAAALKAQGKATSFAEASKDFTLDASGSGPVATVMETGEPLYIQDVATCDTMRRGGLAVDYGLKSICLEPVPGGVLEYGTSDEPSTADWTSIEDARQAVMPKAELKKAFDSGATHVIFWWKKGEEFVAGASYVLPERERMLKAARGDDKTFTSESSLVTIRSDGKGPVATAARSGKEITLEDAANFRFKRASLAKEFNIGSLHFVPCKDGVLEYGTGLSK
mmetsp:Transcript_85119/g.214607  ORF Transcript_85119/g.214607 Transcript_85119/m.214607 type:complete len:611 (-) Transcript_85119:351-2183(-)